MVDKLLSAYINQLSPIIQILFVLILGLIMALLYFAVKRGKDDSVSTSSIEGLETTLRKVIESQQHISAEKPAAAAPAPAGAAPAMDTAQIAKLQADIAAREKREKELQEKLSQLEKSLKEAGAAVPPAAPPVDAAGFEARIRDLEARLKEYEIIEDDIANLSLYKEENARLKDQLNKAGGVPAGIETPKAEAIAEEMGLTKGPSLSDAVASAGGLPDVGMPTADIAAAQAAAPSAEPPQEDLVGALAAALGQEVPADKAPPAPKAPEPAPAAPVEAAPPVEAAAAAPATDTPAPAPEAAAAEPTAGTEISFDPDKLVEEASNLKEDPNASAAVEEGDSGQKLIDEFENFMKESR